MLPDVVENPAGEQGHGGQRDRERSGPERLGLRAACGDCFALCCVALHFGRSAEFSFDKPAGEPCPNLGDDHRCGIHADLRGHGCSGCAVFDCFGAGQKVSQHTFGGVDWRRGTDSDPARARRMFAVFPIMRQLHELLWYLAEALTFAAAEPVHAELRRALDETERLSYADAQTILDADVPALRGRINVLLTRASELARAQAPERERNHRGADLIGARLAGADLRGANLRGALLIAADLRRADLRLADVIGADLRDADLRAADLRGCLFLTQAQLDSAKGDGATRLAPGATRPAHWPSDAGRLSRT